MDLILIPLCMILGFKRGCDFSKKNIKPIFGGSFINYNGDVTLPSTKVTKEQLNQLKVIFFCKKNIKKEFKIKHIFKVDEYYYISPPFEFPEGLEYITIEYNNNIKMIDRTDLVGTKWWHATISEVIGENKKRIINLPTD